MKIIYLLAACVSTALSDTSGSAYSPAPSSGYNQQPYQRDDVYGYHEDEYHDRPYNGQYDDHYDDQYNDHYDDQYNDHYEEPYKATTAKPVYYTRRPEYNSPAPYNRPTRPTTPKPTKKVYTPGELEFKQFWDTQPYCDAELSLVECLLDVDVVQDFATTDRAAGCVERFVQALCKKPASTGYYSGQISVTAESCINDAVVAALYTISNVQSVTIGAPLIPVNLFLADNPDSFTLVKSAITSHALASYSTCVSGSLLRYADSCNGKRVFGEHTSKCLTHILKTCRNPTLAYVNLKEQDLILSMSLNDILTSADVWTDKELHDGRPDPVFLQDGANVLAPSPLYSEANLLGELIAGSENIAIKTVPMDLVLGIDSNTASLKVCPNYYTAINQRIDVTWRGDLDAGVIVLPELQTIPNFGIQLSHLVDLPGFPLDKLAFHFPAQVYDPVTQTWKPKTYEAGTANQFPANTPYDPITPRGGIRDTCEHFYTFSFLAWLAGRDTGDYCFSIDKYSVEFVETNHVADISFESLLYDGDGPPCMNRVSPIDLATLTAAVTDAIAAVNAASAADQPAAATALANAQAAWLAANNPDECNQCYKTTWSDPDYCPRHLARYQMHVRCCRSFNNAQELQYKKDNSYKRVKRGVYTADHSGICTKDLDIEYSTIIVSKRDKGELFPKGSPLPHVFNTNDYQAKIFDIFAIIQGAANLLTTEQKAAFDAALDFFHYDKNAFKDLVYAFSAAIADAYKPNALPLPYHSTTPYLDENDWCKATTSLLSMANVDWSSIISIVPFRGLCYQPSCLLSRYIDCSEVPKPNSSYYRVHNRYIPAYNPASSYLAVENTTSNWMFLGTGGFVAGIVVVAAINAVLKRGSRSADASIPYSHIM